MTINVIFPQNELSCKKIAEKISAFHVEIVANRIMELSCPTAQKVSLIDTVIAEIAREETKSI